MGDGRCKQKAKCLELDMPRPSIPSAAIAPKWHIQCRRLPFHALFEQTHLHADLRTRTTNYVRSTLQQRANRTKMSSSPADCRCARSMGSLEAWPSFAVYSS